MSNVEMINHQFNPAVMSSRHQNEKYQLIVPAEESASDSLTTCVSHGGRSSSLSTESFVFDDVGAAVDSGHSLSSSAVAVFSFEDTSGRFCEIGAWVRSIGAGGGFG